MEATLTPNCGAPGLATPTELSRWVLASPVGTNQAERKGSSAIQGEGTSKAETLAVNGDT